MQPVAVAARRGCASLSDAGWRRAKANVVRALVTAHAAELPPRRRPALSRITDTSVGVAPDVYCWRPEAWPSFAEHDAIVRGGDEATLQGIADAARSRIDLGPAVCAELARYVRRIRPTALSVENLDLADALTVLTHEAEHLRRPAASEAEVACYALQHVRPLVDAAGWGSAFANEIALHGWQISYRRLPARFRTSRCRDGGPLDLRRVSTAWP